MKSKINSFADDLMFVYDIFKEIIIVDEKFQAFIEEKNIYWMDDFPLVNTLLLKYLKNSFWMKVNWLQQLDYQEEMMYLLLVVN